MFLLEALLPNIKQKLPYFNDDVRVQNCSPVDWMKNLKDDVLISEVSLAGTHNSLALYGTVICQCQSMNLHTQLNNGIRYLDVRCCHVKDIMKIHHGMIYQKQDLQDVLQTCSKYLKDYPSEFICMSIKDEYEDSKPHSRSYDDQIQTDITQYIQMLWTKNEIPTVGQARGKIVLIQYFQGKQIGMLAKDKSLFQIFDEWNIKQKDFDTKFFKIQRHLQDSKQQSESNRFFITYISNAPGIDSTFFPYQSANFFNKKLYEYFGVNSQHSKLGAILMDFPGGNLIKIINSRFNIGVFDLKPIQFNQRIRLVHRNTLANLHSHKINYKYGSQLQQVTCFEGADCNDIWIVKRAQNDQNSQQVNYNDLIRLEHEQTGQYLSCLGYKSQLTNQQEVCCQQQQNSDTIFKVQKVQGNGEFWQFQDMIIFLHVNRNVILHSHEGYYYDKGQQEVTCTSHYDINDYWFAENP